jgi:hypothetical protein
MAGLDRQDDDWLYGTEVICVRRRGARSASPDRNCIHPVQLLLYLSDLNGDVCRLVAISETVPHLTHSGCTRQTKAGGNYLRNLPKVGDHSILGIEVDV